MGIIKILSAELAGRIAAGEVIERPASVIKELVENSIDAGATRIRVVTEQGGQRLMQVIDNGKGMDRADAMLCLEAHATSKITTEGDVGQIRTLGFRGEALPSISAVSRFEIQTRPANGIAGTEVIVNNGAIQDIRDCGCQPGTNIKVAFLFGNLPARRKFLKGPSTEDDYIHEMLLMMALSRPGIAFELIQNGREVLRIPAAADMAARVQLLLGKDAFAAMLPVDYMEDEVHVYGFVSKPGFTRNSRREQRVVINGRAASADTVYFAIRDAYESLIVKGRYPGVVLYMDLGAERVDVNVHPTKREVRFREPVRIGQIVANAIRRALRGAFGTLPCDDNALPATAAANATATSQISFSGSGQMTLPSIQPEVRAEMAGGAPSLTAPVADAETPPVAAPLQRPQMTAAMPVFAPVQASLPFAEGIGEIGPTASKNASQDEECTPVNDSAATRPPVSRYHLRGGLGEQYLLADCESGMIVVNVKAATRRILFERMLVNLRHQQVQQQQLLMPLTINLSPDDARMLTKCLEQFAAIGYSIEPFGNNAFVLTAVPANLMDSEISGNIRDILTDLRHNSTVDRRSAITLAQTASRHANVKTAGKLTTIEQEALLNELMHCEMPYADPSGLPTMVHIGYAELQKRFNS